jgi:transcriptional regulator with XRE-family HTH domain
LTLTFGGEIRRLREQKKLRLADVAAQVGVDQTYLSKVENDRLPHTPSPKVIHRLAEVLEADELYLLELADKLPEPFTPFAASADARRFLEAAASKARTSKEWRRLTRLIEEGS